MVWAILAFLGVPLWVCAAGIVVMVVRNRSLRKRHGDIPVRVRRPGKKRWTRGHAIWVSDVFAWRGSPAAWSEDIIQVAGLTLRSPDDEERHKLRRLGEDVRIATLAGADSETLEVATVAEKRTALVGPLRDRSDQRKGTETATTDQVTTRARDKTTNSGGHE